MRPLALTTLSTAMALAFVWGLASIASCKTQLPAEPDVTVTPPLETEDAGRDATSSREVVDIHDLVAMHLEGR